MIRERGPMTVAAFMDLALYDPESGYYARTSRRSGRAGDFFTSVDVGALFGELLAVQIAEMAGILNRTVSSSATAAPSASSAFFDLVEAGAGDGRLSADVLRALRARHSDVYARTRLHLVEASAAARTAQRRTLGELADRLDSSEGELPPRFEGVLVANELLDAMPVHQVVMRDEGLREVYVSACGDTLALAEGDPSSPALTGYLDRLQVSLEPGWRVEINLSAVDWVRQAARRLRRGFIILIDYGHEARELYSVTHAAGTLTTFSRHTSSGAESAGAPWLHNPGEQDMTAHVDFTSVRAAAEEEGLVTLGYLDQTYFLLGLAGQGNRGSQGAQGSMLFENLENLENRENLENFENLENPENLKKRLALKTLIMPGGLGSTMKVLILGKGVGTPVLRGCSFGTRAT